MDANPAASPPVGPPVTFTTPCTFPGPDTLTGAYVRLERLNESHIVPLYAATGTDPRIWTYLEDEPFASLDAFAASSREVISMTSLVLYAVLYEGKVAGNVAMVPVDTEHRIVEIGMIAGPTLQRTRGATEAIYLLLKLSFESLGFRRVEWKCDALHEASRRAALRLGMRPEGLFRQHRIVKGRNRDTAWFALLDGEWGTCGKALELWLREDNFDGEGRQRRGLVDIRREIEGREDGEGGKEENGA